MNKQPKKASDISAKALMTEQQAADYLGISKSTFDKVFTSLNDQRKQLTSYDDYVYIPYIKIGSVYFFQKNELAKWAAYNEENYTEIKIN